MDDKDFEAIGFKCGLEIHQQLLTDRKLFCRCPPVYRNDPAHFRILRHMRPTLSEMGTYDGTALMEFKTRKNITYEFFRDTTCSYEIDDTPPFEMDEKALEISMVIAKAMKCALVDEVHVSRKQYLDGSIPTGFQRTAIISLGGYVPWKDGRNIDIRQISLEEDACREVSDIGHEVVFRTDRLSIPLIEVVTEPDAKNPTEAGELAEVLGWVMRSTKLVRRGPGATRQDVNVSVEGGRRVEIKGVPFIKWIPTITAGEAIRQHNLLKIKALLEERKIDHGKWDVENFSTMRSEVVTDIFKGKELSIFSNWFDGPVEENEDLDIRAVLIPGFGNIFSHPTHGDQTFTDEVSGRLRVICCLDRLPNLISSDDEIFGGIEKEDMSKIRERLGATDNDTVVIIWGPKEDTRFGCEETYLRAYDAFDGVPHETRQVITPDMTSFERILPGPDRMYPDTDRPPIVVTKEILDRVNAQVPAPWWEMKADLMEKGVPENVAHRLVISRNLSIFEKAVNMGSEVKFTAMFIMETLKHLSRKGLDVRAIPEEEIAKGIFWATEKRISGIGLRKALLEMDSTGKDLETVVNDLGLHHIKDEDARKAIEDINGDNEDLLSMFKEGRKGPLMGAIMGSLGDRLNGILAMEILNSSL